MDKYEYRVKTEQMLDYMEKKQFKKAMEIADTIDWRRVKNTSMLNNVSEIYENNGEYQKSRDILFVAYDRSAGSRKIVYRLGTLALRINDIQEASDCYDEFVKLAPKDPNQYILKYKILKAQKAPLAEQISALEDFKKSEYVEKWAYELAKLYHEAGMTSECLEECDDLILWFSEGKYVYQAMELKMKYKPLTPLQQEKYDSRPGAVNKGPFKKPVKKVEPRKAVASITAVIQPIEDREEFGTDDVAEADISAEATRRIPVEKVSEAVEASLKNNKGTAAIEGEEKTAEKKERKKAPIKKIVTGATLEEALATGMAMANKLELDEKAMAEKDEDLRITGQMKIEEILQEWEEKQRTNAEAIQQQKKKDEERLNKEKDEARKRKEADRLEVEKKAAALEAQRKAEAQRREAEAKKKRAVPDDIHKLIEELEIGAQKNNKPEASSELAGTQATTDAKPNREEEFDVEEALEITSADASKNDESRQSERSSNADQEQDERELEKNYTEFDESDFEEDEPEYGEENSAEDDTEHGGAEAVEDDTEHGDSDFDEEDAAQYDETDFDEEDEREYDESDFGEEDEPEYDEPDFDDEDEVEYDESDFGEEDEPEYDESEYDEEDEVEYDESDFVEEDEPEYDDSDFVEEDEPEYDESDFVEEDEPDYDESDFVEEDESDYDEVDFDEDDFEEESDIEDEEDFDEEDLDEEDFEEDSFAVEEDEALEEEEPGELEIEEPSEEEIQKRIKKSKGNGVPFDTGFVVTGRYDLSATSEIGLKAGLTEEQKKLFSYFVPVRGMSEQIVGVLDNDRRAQREGTSKTGNLLVIGRKGSGKTVLAVDIVKAIQKQRNLKQGKVAIVTGESLNKKELTNIVQKLRGGAIIIEKAGKLNSRTVKELDYLMEKKTGELLFVLEDQRKPLERILTANPGFKKKFTSKLELPVFINDELVTFGQTYAKENGYKLDEMGILALYSRIDVMQREDHAVTVAEVKDIMDEAIEHSQKANVKHLARRVFGKSTDDSDRIILKEEDFKI